MNLCLSAAAGSRRRLRPTLSPAEGLRVFRKRGKPWPFEAEKIINNPSAQCASSSASEVCLQIDTLSRLRARNHHDCRFLPLEHCTKPYDYGQGKKHAFACLWLSTLHLDRGTCWAGSLARKCFRREISSDVAFLNGGLCEAGGRADRDCWWAKHHPTILIATGLNSASFCLRFELGNRNVHFSLGPGPLTLTISQNGERC